MLVKRRLAPLKGCPLFGPRLFLNTQRWLMAHGPQEEASSYEGWAITDSAAGSGLSAFQTLLAH